MYITGVGAISAKDTISAEEIKYHMDVNLDTRHESNTATVWISKSAYDMLMACFEAVENNTAAPIDLSVALEETKMPTLTDHKTHPAERISKIRGIIEGFREDFGPVPNTPLHFALLGLGCSLETLSTIIEQLEEKE